MEALDFSVPYNNDLGVLSEIFKLKSVGDKQSGKLSFGSKGLAVREE